MSRKQVEKDNFLVPASQKKNVMLLSDEQAGQLFKACFLHFFGEKLPDIDLATQIVLNEITEKMDENREKWEEECEKRRKAGSLGGSAKASNAKQSVAMLSNAKKSVANVADNDSEYDSENESDNDSEDVLKEKPSSGNKKQKRARKAGHLTVVDEQNMITESGMPAQVAVVLDQWCVYKDEKGEYYTPTGFKSLLTKIKKYIEEYGINATVDGIEQSMASGWKGIFVTRASPKPKDRYAVVDEWLEQMKSGEEVSPFV